MKFMCNFLLAVASSYDEIVKTLATRIIELYATFIKFSGDIFEKPVR